jgi:hypothetical protein
MAGMTTLFFYHLFKKWKPSCIFSHIHMSALLSIPRAEYIIQQMWFIGSIRKTDRVWVSNMGVLERDSNRGVFSAIQRTICCQSRTKTLAGIRKIYEGAHWWLQFISHILTPICTQRTPGGTSDIHSNIKANETEYNALHKNPALILQELKEALTGSFVGLNALKTSYTSDPIFSLEVDILKDYLISVLGNFIETV